MKVFSIFTIFAFASLLVWSEPSRADKLFHDWDRNKDGRLAKEEIPPNPRRNFSRVDTDKDGFISLKEHRKFLSGGDRKQGGARVNTRLEGFRNLLNIPYADTDNPRQTLNLYIPENPTMKKPLPLIAYIHGGGWRSGDKAGGVNSLRKFLGEGRYAAASIGYRLTDEGSWPRQIHDCKAAIRWLKAHARKYNYDPDRIAVMGNSAGGHLVAMLGVSGDVKTLDGQLGRHLKENSRVKCVVDFCGPANLVTMMDQPSRMKHDAPDSPESLLLGGPVRDRLDIALAASPESYISGADAPILVVHGNKDSIVPFPQAVDFHAKLKTAGVDSTLIVCEGMGHGLRSPELDKRLKAFFEKHLLGRKVEVSADPIQQKP
jgi:acetyl esterase/lipase